jgi:hypothetical protein
MHHHSSSSQGASGVLQLEALEERCERGPSWCQGRAWPGTRRSRLAPPKVSPPEQAEDKYHGPQEQRHQQDRRSALGRAQVSYREVG